MLKLKRISVSGFKAIDRFSMTVEPSLTLLLGMNGAGKSSVLQLFSLMRDLADGKPSRFFEDRGWDRTTLRFRSLNNRSTIVRISAVFSSERWGRVRWTIRWGLKSGRLQSEQVELTRRPLSASIRIVTFDQRVGGHAGRQELPALKFEGSLLSAVQEQGRSEDVDGVLAELYAWATRIHSLELLSPVAMKGGARLSANDMGSRGDRLAGFLAGLREEQRSRVVSRVNLFYPLNDLDTVRKRAGWIDLILAERFADFGKVASTQMSDGFMRVLALCAIPELPSVSLILLDELEDGIEPHILGPVVTLVASETQAQIIATSHSPVLANVVGTQALRFISRTPDGRAVAAEVDELPAFRIGNEYLGPGELWTNTALSVLEAQALQIARERPLPTEAEDR